MPRDEVELGTCISPLSTPTCCPLSCLPLCFLSHSFHTISTPHGSFDCRFPWAYTDTHTQIQQRHTHKNSKHTKTHFFCTVQRQLCQLSFDLERKVASTTNNDRHSRNKRSTAIKQKTHKYAKTCGKTCKKHKKPPLLKSKFNQRYTQAATHTYQTHTHTQVCSHTLPLCCITKRHRAISAAF